MTIGVLHSWLVRSLRVGEVAGSNPVTPIFKNNQANDIPKYKEDNFETYIFLSEKNNTKMCSEHKLNFFITNFVS